MGCTSSNQTTDQVMCQISCQPNNEKFNIGIYLDIENSESRMYSIKKNPIVQRRILKSIKPKQLLSNSDIADAYAFIY